MIRTNTTKTNSRNIIYSYLYQINTPLTKQQIMLDLGLSLPTVTNNINQMIKEGLLKQGIDEESKVAIGRKPRAISINEEASFAIGIDISQSHVTFVVTTLLGELKSTQIRDFEFENTTSYYTQLMQFAYRFIQLSEIEFQKVIGIGISLPGIISTNPNTIVFSPELGIENELIPKSFNKYLFPVFFESKVNTGGKYEIGLRNIDSKNLLFLSLEDYVECSFFVNNQLYTGNDGKGMQIGKTYLSKEGNIDEFGKKGTVQSYLSTKALLSSVTDDMSKFTKLYIEKDDKVLKQIEIYVNNLVRLLANLIYSLNCDIVIGSELSIFLIDYEKIINKKVFEITGIDTNNIRISKYPKRSSAIGVTYHFINEFISQI